MKNLLRTLFSPILNPFEKGEGDYIYKPSHRVVLKIMGILFSILAYVAYFFGNAVGEMGALLPMVIFGMIGLVCLVVAFLGTDRAVSTIWRNR